jgi:DNA-binding transcriptional MerR regulator
MKWPLLNTHLNTDFLPSPLKTGRFSMAAISTVSQGQKPDKLIYKIGEVSALTGIPASVIRFWESEFRYLRPKRTQSGQRFYRQTDIDRLMEIKTLLYEKRLTIEGCRQELKRRKESPARENTPGYLDEIRSQLREILEILS